MNEDEIKKKPVTYGCAPGKVFMEEIKRIPCLFNYNYEIARKFSVIYIFFVSRGNMLLSMHRWL